MAKKETDLAKIVKYGKWLEQLLGKKKIENWEIKPLFEEALEILGIEYSFEEEHPFFLTLDTLTEKKTNWSVGVSKLIDKESTLPITSEAESLIFLLKIINNVNYLFLVLNRDDRPWNISYFELSSMLPTSPKKTKTLLEQTFSVNDISSLEVEEQADYLNKLVSYIDFDKVNAVLSTTKIEKLYCKVIEQIIVSPKGCRKIKTFQATVRNKAKNSHYQPFDIIISRVFFEFLIIGGQDYYGYCEYCGSFYIAERKGRKKFCSDVCRTMNQRK